MAKNRGSRSSRKPNTQIFGDPNEPLRLAVVTWMDEMVEMDRKERERVAAEVQKIREQQSAQEKLIESARLRRQQNRGKVLTERRAKLRKERRPLVRDLLKPTGLPVCPNIGYYRVSHVEPTSRMETGISDTSHDQLRQRIAESLGLPPDLGAADYAASKLTVLPSIL